MIGPFRVRCKIDVDARLFPIRKCDINPPGQENQIPSHFELNVSGLH